jgi:LysM repeat protein
MKHSIRFSSTLLLSLLLCFSTFAQQENYPVIQENGQHFYLYTVKPQEGLYGIARIFNVSQADILSCNPSITDALKVGQQIKIPIEEKSTELRKHVVTKKQTLYSIAYLYGTTVDAIVALNPEAEKGIRDGEVLLIPSAIQKENETTNALVISQSPPNKRSGNDTLQPTEKKSTKMLFHKVVAKETLYSLSRKYNVTVDAIQAANPLMKGLEIGSVISIPTGETSFSQLQKEIIKQPKRTIVNANNVTIRPINNKVIKIGILLPFSIDGTNEDGTIDKFVDFYRGALLALLKAKQKGISIELHTYDIEKTSNVLLSLLTKESPLWHVDFIIGPAYSGQVQTIAAFAKTHKIYTIIPFSSQVQETAYNPYLIQFNPSLKWQCEESASLFALQLKNENIIIANLDTSTDPLNLGVMFTTCLRQKLKQLHIAYQNAIIKGGNVDNLQPLFSHTKSNVVVLGDDNIDNAIPYLRNLGALARRDNSLSIYGFPDWDPEQGIFPRLYYSSLFYVSNQNQLNKYDNNFHYWFHTQVAPTNGMRYDLLGYDLTNYFVNEWENIGINKMIIDHLPLSSSNNIQSQFNFHRIYPSGGWVNEEMNLLYYKTGQGIERLNQNKTSKHHALTNSSLLIPHKIPSLLISLNFIIQRET